MMFKKLFQGNSYTNIIIMKNNEKRDVVFEFLSCDGEPDRELLQGQFLSLVTQLKQRRIISKVRDTV